MTKEELFETIRALLHEPQKDTVEAPYTYGDAELVFQVRSALRLLRVVDLVRDTSPVVMTDKGVLAPEPSEELGLLIAYYVAKELLTGDMLGKLRDGDMGMYFRAGPDVMDTRAAVPAFQTASANLDAKYQALLTIIIAKADSATSFFGEPTY
jgi:hypothetical protein